MSSTRNPYNPLNKFDVKIWDVEYLTVEEEVWLARIYQPSGRGPFPALLDVHGGVWSGGDRTSDAFLNQNLAASGLVIVAIDFRLAPIYPYPAQVVDVNFATRWIKAYAQELKIDSNSVGILGASSGGHTAILSAMMPKHPLYTTLHLPETHLLDAAVNWVIALWPVIDPYARYLYAQEVKRTDLVTLTEDYFITGKTMQEGNPQYILDRGDEVELPPMLIIQGTSDKNIPLTIPERFATSYRIVGGKLDLELFPNMPHAFIGGKYPESQHALELMKTWIGRQLAT